MTKLNWQDSTAIERHLQFLDNQTIEMEAAERRYYATSRLHPISRYRARRQYMRLLAEWCNTY
jgi:hypothetical protein